jgi:hypothetical protein
LTNTTPAAILQVGDSQLRARFYEEVGLHGTYDPQARVVDVDARVLNGRVGGGTRSLTPRAPAAGQFAIAA